MVLTDKEIIKCVEEGRLKIDRFIENHVQPASIDLTLGNKYVNQQKYDHPISIIDSKVEYEEYLNDNNTLFPGEFVLATTDEIITLDNSLVGFVEGRSSVGRFGISIQNASVIQPGFSGRITLELFNASKNMIKLSKGMRICQLILMETKSPCEKGYAGKYQGQLDTTNSKLHEDYK
jgi:dCTP deaminase